MRNTIDVSRQARTRTERINDLYERVSWRRRDMQANDSAWLFPLFGLGAGLMVPVASKSSKRNPISNLLALVRRTVGRMIRLTFVTTLLKLWRQPGAPKRRWQQR